MKTYIVEISYNVLSLETQIRLFNAKNDTDLEKKVIEEYSEVENQIYGFEYDTLENFERNKILAGTWVGADCFEKIKGTGKMNSLEAFNKIIELCNHYNFTLVKDTEVRTIYGCPIDNIRKDLQALEILKKHFTPTLITMSYDERLSEEERKLLKEIM